MPHLSPMTWYLLSELMLLSIVIFSSVLWWSYNSSFGVKLVFMNKGDSVLPWN